MDNDWLANLKVGDEVIVSCGWGDGRSKKVGRITATQIVVGGYRYRRSSGAECGRDSRGHIHQPTQERLDRIAHRSLYQSLGGWNWKDESIGTMRKVMGLLLENAK